MLYFCYSFEEPFFKKHWSIPNSYKWIIPWGRWLKVIIWTWCWGPWSSDARQSPICHTHDLLRVTSIGWKKTNLWLIFNLHSFMINISKFAWMLEKVRIYPTHEICNVFQIVYFERIFKSILKYTLIHMITYYKIKLRPNHAMDSNFCTETW